MNTNEAQRQIWKNCLKVIKDNVPPETYKTWFEPIVPLRLNDNILTIEVPTTFFYEYLEEHFINLLCKTLRRELGPQAKLEYSIKGMPMKLPTQNRPDLKNKDIYPNIRNEQRVLNPFAFPGIKKLEIDPRLNKNYSFTNYIEGGCNNLACSAGRSIAEKPGATSFNPLFIWGDSGLGKTHLAHAIGIETMEKNPDKLVLYVEANKFQNQYVDAAIMKNNVNDFLNFYQMIDVLIIDDIHEFSGRNKTKTQNAFFHIFNHLHQTGKQLVLISDKSPADLTDINERLVSRFKWGLSAELAQPDKETRIKILKHKIYNDGIVLPDEVLDFIASKVTTNIRELEGFLISLLARSTINCKEITVELAAEMLDKLVNVKVKELSIQDIVKVVCEHYHLTPEMLMLKSRKREIVLARQIVMYICKTYCNFSLTSIGTYFEKDHTTVIYSTKLVCNLLDTDRKLRINMTEIEHKLGL